MSNRACVLVGRAIVVLLVLGAACPWEARGQGQRKEVAARKAIRDVDPGLFAIVAPGTSFTYRVSLKNGREFDTSNGDGVVVTRTRGNLTAGATRRISNTVFEVDFTSEDTGVGGSATLQINLTNQKGRLKFVRGAVTVALPGGNEFVEVNGADRTILTRLPVGQRPAGIDTAGSGSENFKTAFVANSGGNTVTAIDLPTDTVVATIGVGSQPTDIAVAGILGAQQAFVTNAGSGTVSVVDAQSFSIVRTITVGRAPQGVAIAGVPGAAELAYVANRDDDTVMVIDVVSGAIIQTIPVGDGPTGVAVNGPIGAQIVCVTLVNEGAVDLIEVETGNVVNTIPAGSRPFAVAAGGPALNLFYVASQGSDQLTVVDLNPRAVVARVLVGVQPTDVTVVSTPAGEEIYTANMGDGTLSVVNGSSLQTVLTIPVGGRPRGLATSGPVNLPIILVSV
jgi:YVTN family beta-propeller protein